MPKMSTVMIVYSAMHSDHIKAQLGLYIYSIQSFLLSKVIILLCLNLI